MGQSVFILIVLVQIITIKSIKDDDVNFRATLEEAKLNMPLIIMQMLINRI